MTSPLTPSYREIALNHGQVALVDEDDFERLSAFKWYAKWSRHGRTYYAARTERQADGTDRTIRMHREIMGLKHRDKRHVDHALHITLDNRKFVNGVQNLRIATHRENCSNRATSRNNTSGYKGVSFDVAKNAYVANIKVNYRQIRLGYRNSAEAAWRELYVPAALKYHGRFACLGFKRP
jgi:hypothetical protein